MNIYTRFMASRAGQILLAYLQMLIAAEVKAQLAQLARPNAAAAAPVAAPERRKYIGQ